MLSILGKPDRRQHLCNGLTRRDMLRIGGTAIGGLTLPNLLRLEAEAGIDRSHKALIMIYMCGGPPHQDMYDIKVDAPDEIRGLFKPIDTNVPGVQISEKLPELAKIMDRVVPIRSMVGAIDSHYSYQCMTGHHEQNQPAGGWPHIGSAVSHYEGPVHAGIPPFVSLCYTTQHRPYNEPTAGFLGLGHSSFRPTGPSRDDMVLQGIGSDQLSDRRSLLSSFDRFRRDWDRSGKMDGMDVFTDRAMGILTSSDMFNALDISKEDPMVRERYGEADLSKPKGDGAPRTPQNFLVARRLVEAGARVVTINYGFWDWHSNNFKTAEEEFPVFEKALTALIQDLHERGLDRDVTVLAWGEFGRTPKINDKAGRDHWPRVCSALLAGGGMKTGQVIGSTDRLGGEAADRPVSFQEVFATLYHNLDVNLNSERLFDFRGRPQYLVDPGVQPIAELI
ncbi:MAG: DUF1501 domain-containing protein [Planctomycetaceae bacterium]|nr:DUF1501 domain-containing protein [Planctomycetales bacterium]MCB9922496.1 DUF1501 domain-containing protein [Planctomycetaceae bacterium]